jgi:hypothetical protein
VLKLKRELMSSSPLC